MARHIKALQQANELEETRLRQEQPEDSRSQPQAGHHDIPAQVLQRTIARPGTARPEVLRAMSQAYGNQAVMRLVEKARLERAATNNPTIQRAPVAPVIQPVLTAPTLQRVSVATTGSRIATAQTVQRLPESRTIRRIHTKPRTDKSKAVRRDGENNQDTEALKQKYRQDLKAQKKKRTLLMGGQKTGNMVRQLLTLPFRAIDQLSVVDLHVKDFVKFVKTKKTRNKRNKTEVSESQEKKNKGDAKRALGRTGLYGYLHGLKSHKMMYGNADGKKIPVLGSDYNPLKLLGNINTEGIKKVETQISLTEEKLWKLEHPGEEKYKKAKIDLE